MSKQEEREKALETAVTKALLHFGQFGIVSEYPAFKAKMDDLSLCVPVPRAELARYKRALWLLVRWWNRESQQSTADKTTDLLREMEFIDTSKGCLVMNKFYDFAREMQQAERERQER